MLWGSNWGLPWGDPDDMVATIVEVLNFDYGMQVKFIPAYDQYYRLDLDGYAQPPVYIEAGTLSTMRGTYRAGGVSHVWSIVPQGDWPDASVDSHIQQAQFMQNRADRIRSDIIVRPAFFSYGIGGGQFSSWDIDGITRFKNCKPGTVRKNWGELSVVLTTDAGVHTLQLKLNERVMASGSRTGDGEIVLAEQNDSGISGTVTLAYSADTDEAVFAARFPTELKVHYKKTGPFILADFPRVAEKTIKVGQKTSYQFDSGKIESGTYYVVVHQVSDDGNESAGVGGEEIEIYAVPAPPTNLAYASGDAADTVISFTNSPDELSEYNIYDSGDTEFLDLETPVATVLAGVGTLTQALAAIDAGFTGTRYVVARAVLDGIEEGNLTQLKIEYLAGVRISPLPPSPKASTRVTISGRALTVPYSLSTINQAEPAALVQLFVWADGDAVDYDTPQATAAVPDKTGSVVNGSVSYSAPSDGPYYFALRTVTTGGRQSENIDAYGPVILSTVVPDDPEVVSAGGF